MNRLSTKQIQALAEARERGVSLGVLKRKYGVCGATVIYHCDNNGVVPPKGIRRLENAGSHGVTVTKAERDEMERLSKAGKTPWAIAKLMNRPYSTIRYRLSRDALLNGLGI